MVGSGFMSRAYAFGIRELVPDARLVAIYGGRSVEFVRAGFGLAVEPTLDALLARADVDIVFLGTPTPRITTRCLPQRRQGSTCSPRSRSRRRCPRSTP